MTPTPNTLRGVKRALSLTPAVSLFTAGNFPGVLGGVGGFLRPKGTNMDYFSELPEGQAIIASKGVYRQVKIAVRSGKVFARYGAGYVRLATGGATSHPTVRWYQVDAGDGSYTEEKGSVWYTPPVSIAAE